MMAVWRVALLGVILAGMPAGVRAGGAEAGDGSPVSISPENPAHVKASAATRAKLGKMIRFSVTDQTLGEAMAALGRGIEANVVVDWTALATAGIDKTTRVTLNLEYEASADVVLELLLREAGGPAEPLGFGIDKGILIVSTKDELNSERYRVVRIYDVRDLVAAGPEEERNLARGERIRELLNVIKATVAPTSWVDNGGTIGSIVESDGRLVVNQVGGCHVELENLLTALRWSLSHPEPPAAKAPTESKADARAKVRLAQAITLFYEDRLLDDVLKDLSEKTMMDVVVDWAELSAAGFAPDQKVNVTLRHAQSAEDAISLLLASIKPVKTPGDALGWQVKKGTIVVSTRLQSTEVRVYDIADVIAMERHGDEMPADIVRILRTTIEGIVAPESWIENGGIQGTIVELHGRLIVRQTRENLARVEQLLAVTRKTGRMPTAPAAGAGR